MLLVTLNKLSKADAHRYVDHWVDDQTLRWQSQRTTTPDSKRGQELINHREFGQTIHLFVRGDKLRAGKAAPFIYHGQVEYSTEARGQRAHECGVEATVHVIYRSNIEAIPVHVQMTIYAVIDFETTGLSPSHGARPTEIAAVLVRNGKIVDRYQSLMNAGVHVPYEIQQLTGITNDMVRQAPAVAVVMAEVIEFVGTYPIVCHNAAFDRKFWEHEATALQVSQPNRFVCSLLLARRLFPDAPNHKLATLVRALGLPSSGMYHRALADAECTAHLLIRLMQEVGERFSLVTIECELLMALQKASKHRLVQCVSTYSSASKKGMRSGLQ